jgi:hypothetical protein
MIRALYRCAYCKRLLIEIGVPYKKFWCSRKCYEDDRDRYLEDKRDGERDERDIRRPR